MNITFYNKHYIRIDSNNNIIRGFSDGAGWSEKVTPTDILLTDRGEYQFRLLPNGEENPSLTNMQGIYLYKYIDGKAIAKTQEEIQAEIDALPKPIPEPTNKELEAMTYYVGMMTGVL